MGIVIINVSSSYANKLFEAVNSIPRYLDSELINNKENQGNIYKKLEEVPGLSEWSKQILSKVDTFPYGCILDGLCFDDNRYLLIGLSNIFGIANEPYKADDVAHTIQPSSDILFEFEGKPLVECFHTDGSSHLYPPDVFFLQCVSPDQNGEGQSEIIPIETLVEGITKYKGDSFIQKLKNPKIPWKLCHDNEDIIYDPILSNDSLRWMKYTIAMALSENDDLDLDRSILSSIDEFDSILDPDQLSNMTYKFGLKKNQLLICNNKKVLHRRTHISKPEQSNRILLETRVRRYPNPS